MSSIPQSAHAAVKVHMMMSEGHWTPGTLMANDAKAYGNDKDVPTSWQTWINQFMDHPLAKYNSKMMNSIWGLYNRYSVHNFKRVTEEEVKGKAGDWVTTVAFNQKSQETQSNQTVTAATNVGLPATAFPTASAQVRDTNPLHSFWFSSHHH